MQPNFRPGCAAECTTVSRKFRLPIITPTLSFEQLPEAVAALSQMIMVILAEIKEMRTMLVSKTYETPVYLTAKEACELLGECRNSLYEKARAGIIPAYKTPGTKAWRFVRSELLDYVASGKPKSRDERYRELVDGMNKGLRPGGRNKPITSAI